jgi:hypothetical protein
MTNTTAAYMAGMIDGEGTITLTQQGKHEKRSPAVSVASTSKQVIDDFFRVFGGAVIHKKPAKSNHSPSWECRLCYSRALNCLRSIRPFLRHPEKVRRADMLLTEYASITPRNGKYTPAMLQARAAFETRFFQATRSPGYVKKAGTPLA